MEEEKIPVKNTGMLYEEVLHTLKDSKGVLDKLSPLQMLPARLFSCGFQ